MKETLQGRVVCTMLIVKAKPIQYQFVRSFALRGMGL